MAYYRGILKYSTFPTELRIITSILPRASKQSTAAQRRGRRVGRAAVNKLHEHTEDASALEAEEGRGDRRNVQGELHTSDEP